MVKKEGFKIVFDDQRLSPSPRFFSKLLTNPLIKFTARAPYNRRARIQAKGTAVQ